MGAEGHPLPGIVFPAIFSMHRAFSICVWLAGCAQPAKHNSLQLIGAPAMPMYMNMLSLQPGLI